MRLAVTRLSTLPPRPRPIGTGVAIRDPGGFWSDRFRLFGKKSQMVRRDFSRAVPETFAMVDGHIATKRITFFGTKSEKGRSRFHSVGPRDVCRWSMVGWSTGTRMVAVDVAIAHRGPRDVAGWSMVGVEGRGGVGARTHVNRRRPMSACARRRLAHLGHRCTSHRQAPWRHGSNNACGRSLVAIATPGPTSSRRDHGTGSRWSKGSQGGRGWGLRRVRCRCVVEIGPPERQAVSERAEDQTAARLVSEDLVIPGRGYACG